MLHPVPVTTNPMAKTVRAKRPRFGLLPTPARDRGKTTLDPVPIDEKGTKDESWAKNPFADDVRWAALRLR
jgi:hypothetical protein